MTTDLILDMQRQVQACVAEEAREHKTGPARQEFGPQPFHFLPLDELLARPMPPKWLILDYLEQCSVASLFGSSGSMKTFVALDMGLSVASGLPWHRHEVPNPGPVFYICGEGFKGLARRIRAWMRDRGVTTPIPFFTSNAAVHFLDAESLNTAMAAIARLVEQYGQPRLVIVDTLNRNFGPGDENSTHDMTAFIAALDRLKAHFGCAVLVVHHTGLQEQTRARGASAFRAALDHEYRLDVKGNIRTLICTKAKDFEEPAAISFEPEPVGTGWWDEDEGREIISCVLRRVEATLPGKKKPTLSGAQRIAYEALDALCGEAADGKAHVDHWRAEAYRRGVSSSTKQDTKKKAFQRAVGDLLDAGHIDTDSDYYWPSKSDQDKTGQIGTCPACPGTERDTPLKGCPVCPDGPIPPQAEEEDSEEDSR